MNFLQQAFNGINSDAEEMVLTERMYSIPKAGVEAIPLGTIASVDLNGSGAEAGFLEFTAESTLGGVLIYSAYQAVLTLLRSEAARKAGDITRVDQLKLVLRTSVDAGKSSAFTMLVASAIVAVMPWLAWPLGVLGIVGGGVMAGRIANEFWMALSYEQQTELRTAAEKAKVNIERMIPKTDDGDEGLPAPMPA